MASPGGSVVFVTGVVVRDTPSLTFATETVAYSATTGALLWQARYNPGGTGDTEPGGIAVSPDGSTVFVTGSTRAGSAAHYSAITVAYSAATGAALWTDISAAFGEADSVAVSPDGSAVYISGGETSASVMALDAATGATLWAAGSATFGRSVAVSPGGSAVFVAGSAGSTSNVAAYNATTGAQIWARDFTPGTALADAVSPDGSKVYVAGDGTSATGVATYVTAGYDAATGARLWSRAYLNKTGGSTFTGLAVSASMVFVTGTTGEYTTLEYGTVAYDATTGSTAWIRLLKGRASGDAQPDAIAVSPDGSEVFVTGDRKGKTAFPMNTVAYDAATGTSLWIARYGRTTGDGAAITVSPDSSTVYVTGTGPAGMTTLAYGS